MSNRAETRGGKKPKLPINKRRVSLTIRVLPNTSRNIRKLARGELGKVLDRLYSRA